MSYQQSFQSVLILLSETQRIRLSGSSEVQSACKTEQKISILQFNKNTFSGCFNNYMITKQVEFFLALQMEVKVHAQLHSGAAPELVGITRCLLT